MTESLSDSHQHPKIAVIVVHWMSLVDTIECLRSLGAVAYPALEVLVVNNGSVDFDEPLVRDALPGVRIVTSAKNLGFAGGNNLGLEAALADGADYVLLLNNDTVVEPSLVAHLLSAAEATQAGIIGPVISNYYDDGTWFAGGGYARLIGLSFRQRPLASFGGTRDVAWVNGCALMARREVFAEVGMLWEPFFLNAEEIDLCLRARRAGYRCVQLGEALVRHKISASGGVRGSDRLSPDKAYYFARNQVLLAKRNLPGWTALVATISQAALVLPLWALTCIVQRNARVLPHYLRGLADGLAGRAGPRPRPQRL